MNELQIFNEIIEGDGDWRLETRYIGNLRSEIGDWRLEMQTKMWIF